MHLKTEDGFVSGDCWSLISWTLNATRRLCPLAQTRWGNVQQRKWATVSCDELGLRLNQQWWDDPKGHHVIMMTGRLLRCSTHWPGGRWATLRAEERACVVRITSDLLISDFQPLECSRQVMRISVTSPPPPSSHVAASPRWLVSLTQSQRAVLIWSPGRWSMAVIDGDYDKHPLKHI